jgi:hypothetical protein
MTEDTNAALAEFLAQHPRCELCESMALPVQAATVAVPRKQGLEERSVLYTITARHPLCSWCAQLVAWAREDGGGLRGHTVGGFPVDPAHPWNAGRRR